MHTVSPAHSFEDLRLSYIHNLPRDGVLESVSGNFTGPFYATPTSSPIMNPNDPKLL